MLHNDDRHPGPLHQVAGCDAVGLDIHGAIARGLARVDHITKPSQRVSGGRSGYRPLNTTSEDDDAEACT